MVPDSLPIRIVVLCLLAAFLVTCKGSPIDVKARVAVAFVELTPGTGTVEIGQSTQLTATPKGANGDALDRSVTWRSSDPAVATVDADGFVTGISRGTSTITATSEGVKGTATIWVIEVGAYNCSAQSQVSEVECWALVALQEALGGPEEPEGWLADATPCIWHGVTCETGSVVELNLHLERLTGSISPELGNLANLEYLALSFNQLTGSIPPELGNLANLEYLSLRGTQLTGSIPPELGNLSNLQYLDLEATPLTGSIPPELGNLSNLQTLDLERTQLTGSIPRELGNLANLWTLDLHANELAGSIPPELGNLASLEALFLGGNQLAGSVPPELGNLANLEALFLEGNQLTGPIPPELGDLTNLRWLWLYDNQLSGLVPLSVAQKGGVIQSLFGLGQCHLVPPHNDGLFMPDTQDYRKADLDGDGLICGLGLTAGLTPNSYGTG